MLERVIRLVNGSGPHEGRIEVLWDGQWGTVCDDRFDESDGDVICRYLGFPGLVAVHHRAQFGEGTGPIVMDDLGCIGHEDSPFSCEDKKIGTSNCGHNEDASIICQSMLI